MRWPKAILMWPEEGDCCVVCPKVIIRTRGEMTMVLPKRSNGIKLLLLAVIIGIASVQQHGTAFSIISGSSVTVAEQEGKGLVQVGGGCSGVLLTNDVVLTAGHCISNRKNPFSVNVTANWGSQSKTSNKIYHYGGYNDPNGIDLAIVFLSSPFQVNGSTSGFNNQLNISSQSSLVNQTLDAYGLGVNTLTNTGFGTWRTGRLTISSTGTETYAYLPNSAGQVISFGDSGGPDFINSQITGIHSGISYECSNGSTSATCRATITKITSGFSTSVPAAANAIQAVRATQWNPTVITQYFDVFGAEINETRWGFTDVNTVAWARAARAADLMCNNRGFIGGHFNGNQILNDARYGLQCSGKGVIWHDATSAEIANTGWGFTDVNTVEWARANRAATMICEGFNQGFAGGHFTGWMGPDRYGLYCYKDGAKFIDATSSELAATGWPITNVDATPWAWASRAAISFCQSKGYNGGFLNGNQLNGKYGAVCQGNTASATSLPTLQVNYTSGASGSYLTLNGSDFDPNSTVSIIINGTVLGTIQADATGNFTAILSTAGAPSGKYDITTDSPSAPTDFTLNPEAPLHAKEGSGPEFSISPNFSQNTVYLPLIQR